MRLIEPGWTVASRPARLVGRLRIDGVDAAVDDAVDAALDAAGLTVRDVRLPGWDAAYDPFGTILVGELWRAHQTLLDAEGVGEFVNAGLHAGRAVSADRLADAMSARAEWQAEIAAALGNVDAAGAADAGCAATAGDRRRGIPTHAADSPVQLRRCPRSVHAGAVTWFSRSGQPAARRPDGRRRPALRNRTRDRSVTRWRRHR